MRRTETEYSRAGLALALDYECCLSTKCHHVSNDDYYGTPFLLEKFQRENMWKPLFACGEMVNGRFQRKFRRAIFGLPSGFGKTELAAALVLTVATMEVVYNGQYGVVASSKDQVRNIYDKIVTMIKLDPDLKEQWDDNKNVIVHKETGAKIMVLPNKADAFESWHFNVIVFDELHVYRDEKVWAAGLKGQKVLRNPLSIGITTAADSREGFLWDTLDRADDDPGLYLYWLGLDDDDDIEDPEAWDKLMVAPWVTWESIQDQRAMAASKRSFERYTANRFPRSKDEYSCFKQSELNACEEFDGAFDFNVPFTVGIDGATSGDSFAIVAYQERGGIGYAAEWVYDEPDPDLGHYDLSEIMELIAWLSQEHYPEVIGIDPNRLLVMDSQLKSMYGIETVSFAQNNATMCSATSLVVNKVHEGKLCLKGCPKTKEHLGNTVEETREPYGMRFGKDSKKSKIDGAIALAIAMLAYEKLVVGQEDTVPVG